MGIHCIAGRSRVGWTPVWRLNEMRYGRSRGDNQTMRFEAQSQKEVVKGETCCNALSLSAGDSAREERATGEMWKGPKPEGGLRGCAASWCAKQRAAAANQAV